jgi:hypothetical protein
MAVFELQGLVHYVLKIPKISGLQCINQTIIKPVEETVLFLLALVHIIWGVVLQLGDLSNILIHRLGALLQVLDLFLFQLDHALRNTMSAERSPELLPINAL